MMGIYVYWIDTIQLILLSIIYHQCGEPINRPPIGMALYRLFGWYSWVYRIRVISICGYNQH